MNPHNPSSRQYLAINITDSLPELFQYLSKRRGCSMLLHTEHFWRRIINVILCITNCFISFCTSPGRIFTLTRLAKLFSITVKQIITSSKLTVDWLPRYLTPSPHGESGGLHPTLNRSNHDHLA